MPKKKKPSVNVNEELTPKGKAKGKKENITDLPEPEAQSEDVKGGLLSSTQLSTTQLNTTLGTQPLSTNLSTGGVLGGLKPQISSDNATAGVRG
jgi:hypothetical protein